METSMKEQRYHDIPQTGYDLFSHFEKFELARILHFENAYDDALSKLTSCEDSKLLKIMPIEYLTDPRYERKKKLCGLKAPHR